ncbi:MAG: ABC transporter substrate-binding protein [Gammaproteobacteria bacterium]|nr:ABC transporter substrate-binding protein [Gammaproteobacteria bacterium]MBU1646361.1 ABC transporter substrate-binding protein [Gammaproteobacteria bacterium]MBU1970904.1 ABC transporter substrate-binding protein [Gammaproteobacteria bacterium]
MPAVARPQTDDGETLIRINIPGPQALPFLPIDLIPLLNFDREMGGRLVVRYKTSGVHAIEDVLAGNADFAALGFSTLPVLAARGKDVVAISPLSGRTPPLGVIVRKDLANAIRGLRDMKGRTIATSTGSINSRTYLQMAALVVLRAHGVAGHQVRWLAAGQNWDSLSGALISKAADAVFCEEPFTSRLVRNGLGVLLTDLTDPRVAARIPGLGHVRTAVATTRAMAHRHPEKVELFVRMLRRSLVWVQSSPPELVAEKAGAGTAEERQERADLLRKMPGIYNADGRFSEPQIAATDIFLRAAAPDMKLAAAVSLIDDRWAGSRR